MALPIRQRLSAITCLKAGPKAVLIEVCELAENAGRGCFASNDTLAKKLGVSLATVTRTIASLVGYDLLSSRVVAAEANRRYLAPTATVVACYKGGTEAEQLAAVAGLTIVKSEPAPEMTIVKPGADYSQNGNLTIVKNDTDYSQNASRVIGDDHYEQLESQDDQSASLRCALAAAQKRIGELEFEIDHWASEMYGEPLRDDLKRRVAELEAENATLKANAQASQTKGAGDVATRKPAAKHPTYDQVLAYFTEKRPHNLGVVPTEAEKFIDHYSSNGWKVGRNPMQDWQAACRNWLKKVPERGPLVQQPITQHVFQAQTRYQPASQVATRAAAIAGADAMFDALAAGQDPYSLNRP